MEYPENSRLSQLIFQVAQQRYDAMALRLVRPGEAVPEIAVRPWEQTGRHLALCQAFAMARRAGQTVYMRREDHWCWAPLVAFGAVSCRRGDEAFERICDKIGIADREEAAAFVEGMPRVPLDSCDGVLVAPLGKAAFQPDVVLINCRNDQLRTLLMAIKTQTGKLLESSFDPLDSCVWSVLPPLSEGSYRITLPDPGDYARALTDENDIILTVPRQRLEEFQKGLEVQLERGMVNSSFLQDMEADFARPPFYNELFRSWGLPEGRVWSKG